MPTVIVSCAARGRWSAAGGANGTAEVSVTATKVEIASATPHLLRNRAKTAKTAARRHIDRRARPEISKTEPASATMAEPERVMVPPGSTVPVG